MPKMVIHSQYTLQGRRTFASTVMPCRCAASQIERMLEHVSQDTCAARQLSIDARAACPMGGGGGKGRGGEEGGEHFATCCQNLWLHATWSAVIPGACTVLIWSLT